MEEREGAFLDSARFRRPAICGTAISGCASQDMQARDEVCVTYAPVETACPSLSLAVLFIYKQLYVG